MLTLLLADLSDCGLSRAQVAYAMSAELNAHITVAQIDAIVSATKVNRLPAEWVGAWMKATGSRRILDQLCADAGLTVATKEDQQFAELGRLEVRRRGLWEQLL